MAVSEDLGAKLSKSNKDRGGVLMKAKLSCEVYN